VTTHTAETFRRALSRLRLERVLLPELDEPPEALPEPDHEIEEKPWTQSE
jgi:hypothetical protein